jgi:hypothetical protein
MKEREREGGREGAEAGANNEVGQARRERETERDRATDRETDKGRERGALTLGRVTRAWGQTCRTLSWFCLSQGGQWERTAADRSLPM